MKFLFVLIAVIAIFSANPSIAEEEPYRVFVGGLSWNTSEDTVREAFSSYGEVVSTKIVLDRDTGRSRGFGFVEFNTAEEAQRAIEELNDRDLDGRRITVNLAGRRRGQRQ